MLGRQVFVYHERHEPHEKKSRRFFGSVEAVALLSTRSADDPFMLPFWIPTVREKINTTIDPIPFRVLRVFRGQPISKIAMGSRVLVFNHERH